MPYNLIHERWIPVRRADGSKDWIEPWRVTDPDNPPIALNAPRPDFNGALIQFLIGLVQTTCPPETERDWRRWFKQPPQPEVLKAAFSRYERAFNLDGDGPRFMQDLADLSDGNEKPLQLLLLDAPSNNAVEENKDHFTKDNPDLKLSHPAVASALLTFQLNVHSTGAGGYHHRLHSTLRGPGPVTTLVLGKDLWETIWLNVISKPEFDNLGASRENSKDHDIFPWLAVTRSSESVETTTREDVHPAQMFWPMSRRIRLKLLNENAQCTFSGLEGSVYGGFIELRDGINYQSPWQHPLSPSRGSNAISVQGGQFTYQNWTEFIGAFDYMQPALVVRKCFSRNRHFWRGSVPKLWVFGYEIESRKANVRAYRERTMPLFLVLPAIRPDFEEFARQLVEAAVALVGCLTDALVKALYPETGRRPKGASSSSVIQDAASRFWRDTEPNFYGLLRQARETLQADPEASLLLHLREQWLKTLRKHLLRLFDEVTQYGAFRGADPRSVVKAREELSIKASPYDKKTRETLSLPKP